MSALAAAPFPGCVVQGQVEELVEETIEVKFERLLSADRTSGEFIELWCEVEAYVAAEVLKERIAAI